MKKFIPRQIQFNESPQLKCRKVRRTTLRSSIQAGRQQKYKSSRTAMCADRSDILVFGPNWPPQFRSLGHPSLRPTGPHPVSSKPLCTRRAQGRSGEKPSQCCWRGQHVFHGSCAGQLSACEGRCPSRFTAILRSTSSLTNNKTRRERTWLWTDRRARTKLSREGSLRRRASSAFLVHGISVVSKPACSVVQGFVFSAVLRLTEL